MSVGPWILLLKHCQCCAKSERELLSIKEPMWSAGGRNSHPHASTLEAVSPAQNKSAGIIASAIQTSNPLSVRVRPLLRGTLRLQLVIRQIQTRFVAVRRVLVQNALGDRLIDRRHRRMQQICRRRGIARRNRRAETLHRSAHTRAVRTVHICTLARLRRAL